MGRSDADTKNSLKLFDGVLMTLSVCVGVTLFLVGISKYGIGLTGDSMNYLALSENLLDGKGFVGLGDTPFVLWPPGYSLIISFFITLSGFDYHSILIVINIISLSTTLILSYLLFRQKFELTFLRYYGLGMLVIAPGVYLVWVFAFAEIIFMPIMLLFLFYCEKWRDDLSLKRIIWLSLLTLIMFFVKYIGIVAFPLVIYLIYTGDRVKWLHKTIIASTIILIPALLWILRNLLVVGSPFGQRGGSIYNILEVAIISTETFLYWVFPVVFLVPVLLIFTARALKLIDVPFSELIKRFDLLLIFTVLFLGATFLSSSISAFDRLNNRLLFPVFIPLLIIFMMFLEILKDNLAKFRYQKFMIVAGLVLMIIPIGAYIRTDIRSFNLRIKNGAGGIATDEFQIRLPKLSQQIIRQLKIDLNVYSNNPELLYYASGIQTKKAPRKFFYNSEDVDVKTENISTYFSSGLTYLIWLGENSNELSYSPEELQKYVNIKLIDSGLNFKLFEISGRR